MTTKIAESAHVRSLEQVAREQFEAFERQERSIKTEEREERAVQLKLPLNFLNKVRRHRVRALENG